MVSVTVVVVDPALEASVPLGLRSELSGVSVRPRRSVGDEVRALSGEGLIHGHVVGPEPILGPLQKLHQRLGSLVIMGLFSPLR